LRSVSAWSRIMLHRMHELRVRRLPALARGCIVSYSSSEDNEEVGWWKLVLQAQRPKCTILNRI
jgi:hypothetical protein